MAEIEVVKSEPTSDRPARFESEEEIKVMYDQISKETGISQYHIKSFIDMEMNQLKASTSKQKPDIEFLLLRKIIEYENILPIVKTYYKPLNTMEDIQTVVGIAPAALVNVTGGRVKPGKPQKPGKPHKSPKPGKPHKSTKTVKATKVASPASPASVASISLRASRPDHIVFLKDVQSGSSGKVNVYRAAQGQELDICGYLLMPRMPMFEYYLQRVPGNMDIRGRLRSGSYTEDYLYHQYLALVDDEYYRFEAVAHDAGGEITSRGVQILFTSEDHAKHVSSILFDYITDKRYESQYSRPSDRLSVLYRMPTTPKRTSAVYDWLSRVVNISEESPMTSVSRYKSPKIDPNMLVFYARIEKHFPVAFNYTFWESPHQDLISLRIKNLAEVYAYYAGGARGTAAQAAQAAQADVDRAIAQQDMHNAIMVSNAASNKKYTEGSLTELRYRWIYIMRFGQERLSEITRKLPSYDMTKVNKLRLFGTIMDHVTPREKKIILQENARIVKLMQASRDQESMPWNEIYRRLRYTTDNKKRALLLNDLKKYLQKNYKSVKNEIIHDVSGKHPIICPHVLEMIEMRLEHKTDSQIQKVLSSYADDIPLFSAYYCKVCGEKMYSPAEMEADVSFEGDDQVPGAQANESDDILKDWMWKQASYIVRNNIEFRELTSDRSINKFITSLVTAMYQFIHLIEKKLMTVKTDTDQIVDDKKKTYMSIYTWAMLVKVVTENKSKLHFTSPRKLNNAKDMFVYARNRLMNSLNVVISRIPDMDLTEKWIDGSLRKAYQNLQGIIGKSSVNAPEEVKVEKVLEDDSTFIYVSYMRGVEALQRLARSRDVRPVLGIQAVNTVNKVMQGAETPEAAIGKKASTLDTDTGYIFANIPPINLSAPKATPPAGNTRWEAFHHTLAKAQVDVMRESIKYSIDYVKGRTFMDSPDVVTITKTGDSFHIDVRPKDTHVALDRRSHEIRDKERSMYAFMKHYYARAYRTMPVNALRRYDATVGYNSLAIEYGYDVNKGVTHLLSGTLAEALRNAKKVYHKHEWRIVAYVKIAVYRPERRLDVYKKDDVRISTGSDVKLEPDYVFADMLCAKCFHVRSTSEEDIENIKKFADRELEITNFYRFYEFQCPKPDKAQQVRGEQAHAFSGESQPKCKNCGFKKVYAQEHNLEYYKKYIAEYRKERKTVTGPMPVITTSERAPLPTVSKVISSWKYKPGITNEFVDATYDILTKGSSLTSGFKPMKISKREYANLMNNIGLTERIEYDEIVKGTASPYKELTPEMARARTDRIGAIIQELILDYVSILNYENLSKPGMEAKELMNTATPADITAIHKLPSVDTLTPLNTEYSQAYMEAYTYTKADPTTMSQFTLQYLFSALLGIMRVTNKSGMTKKFANELILFFMSSILRGEKIFASVKAARLAALQAEQKASEMDDANMIDNRQSRMFDDLVDPEYVDKFDFSDVDYDGHNDDINT